MRRPLFAAAFFFALLPAALSADGLVVIYPPGPPMPPRPPMPRPVPPPPPPRVLPVSWHRVTVEITDAAAVTTVDQAFRNETDADLEGTYLFPLPDDTAVARFSLFADGKELTGEVLDKETARRTYEDIVRRMRDPGLLEYAGRNLFRARIYPIPARGEKRVRIVYHQTLPRDAGTYRYRYPLNTERFSPKPIADVSISARISCSTPIRSVYSPSHPIDVRLEPRRATAGFEQKNVKPEKDFLLYYSVSEKDVGVSVLTHRPDGKEGWFMALVSPGAAEGKALPKDIVFVADTSGSMAGEKLSQAQEALRFCLRSLAPKDRFSVIRFSTGVEKSGGALAVADRAAVSRALSFVDDFAARGGTNINDALAEALGCFSGENRPRMVVFLTDGAPTVGTTDIKDLLRNVSRANTARARVFVFGVGTDVNTHLLDLLAEEQRGACEYVLPGESIETRVSSFYAKVSDPVLADCRLDFGRIGTRDVHPGTIPDIFSGGQLVVVGRYEGSGPAAVRLAGTADGRRREIVGEADFPAVSRENDFIPRIWAARRVAWLTGQIRLNGESRELVDEIVRLSREYGIITPYTSLLIVEKDEGGGRPVPMPALPPAAQREGAVFRSAMNRASGADSVAAASSIGRMKGERHVAAPAYETIRIAGDKTFYQGSDGVWTDSRYTPAMRTSEIAFLGDAYFDLLGKHPGIGTYLAVGRSVIVVIGNAAYRIVEQHPSGEN